MQVTLTSRQEEFVKTKVKSGRYLDESEVVREALRLLEDYTSTGEPPELEALVAAGWDSGGFEPWCAEMKDRILQAATAHAKA